MAVLHQVEVERVIPTHHPGEVTIPLANKVAVEEVVVPYLQAHLSSLVIRCLLR